MNAVLQGFHHSGFTVSDMERSLAFYRDVLGLPVVADMQPEADYPARVTGFLGATFRIVFLQLAPGGHILELIQYKTRAGEPLPLATNRPGCGHICFLVDDLPAVYERLHKQQGVTFVSAPVPITQGANRGGYAVYLRDPDGITVELLQRPRS
ncbi:MAG: VOC family protein [Chloroflexi bacterium]|nr:VOC family protein [Chloroflexota bacterium]